MFALIDANNFYCSCQRVFEPYYRNKPVAVLSNNDGCLVARSNEVKALQVPMGAPYFEWKPLLDRHQVKVYSSNYELYADMSNRIHQIIADFMPAVENYSIDEAFADMTGISDPKAVAFQLRKRIWEWVEIPVSIGFGPTKTLAKMANHIAKKNPEYNGVYVIETEEKRIEALKHMEVGDVWGIGRQISNSLNKAGIYTAWQLTQAPLPWIRQKFNVVMLRTVKELQGECCIVLEEVPPVKKGITSSRSFSRKVTDIESLYEAISTYTERAAAKMRRANLYVPVIQVMLRTSPFMPKYYANSVRFGLPFATNDTAFLIRYAKAGIKRIFLPGYHYQKCGIDLLELTPASGYQQDLLEKAELNYDRPRREAMMQAIDRLNQRYGKGTLTHASSGIKQSWQMLRDMCSPRYTTRWEDLLRIKAGV